MAADIVVKKADESTNITYTNLTGASGDSAPAVYRSESATGTVGQRPTFMISAKWNGPKTARRIEISGSFPSVYTDANSGLTQVRSVIPLTMSMAVPTNIVATDVAEAAHQMCNLLASSVVKTAISNGYAPV